MKKKINKIFGLVFIIQLVFGGIISAQDIGWDEVKPNLLRLPDVFSTYPKSQFISDINQGVEQVASHLQGNTDAAWVVYSDREDNVTYHEPYGDEDEVKNKLTFMQYYYVDKVQGNWLHLVTVRSSGISGKKIDKNLGWIKADKLILSRYPVLNEKGAPRKKMVLISASNFKAHEKIDWKNFFADKHFFSSPDVENGNLKNQYKTSVVANTLQVLFVLKETPTAVILCSSDYINRKTDVKGWIHNLKTTSWDTRVCLEPVSGIKARRLKGSDEKYPSAYVFLDAWDLREYFSNSSFISSKTYLKEVKIRNRRMGGKQMRYPVMPYPKNGNTEHKIAVIAQLGEVVEGPCNRECQLEKLKHELDSIQKLANNVNALIVIDGTSSMQRYGPVVAKSIEKIINERKIEGKQSMRWGVAIYRDYADKKRIFEIIPLNDDYRGVVNKLRQIDYSSNNPKDSEAHYYGMTEAIKNAGFINGQSNIIVLVGDAGNHMKDKNKLTKESVTKLLAEKRINLISFQVEHLSGERSPPYSKFGSDVKSYIRESGKRFINSLQNSKGLEVKLNPGDVRNSYSLGFSGFEGKDTKPMFGVFNQATPGTPMKIKTFRNNLVNAFLEYMDQLDARAEVLHCHISGDCGEKIVTGSGEVIDMPTKDLCRLLNISDKVCEYLSRAGDVSVSGYTHMKIDDKECYTPVAFISIDYKKMIDERLGQLAYITGSEQASRDKFLETLVVLIKGLVGENTPASEIRKWTFDQAWQIILNVPFSERSSLNNKRIDDLLTENITGDEFEIFLENFKSQTKAFIEFPKTQKEMRASEYLGGSQTFYWIPFSKIPRGADE